MDVHRKPYFAWWLTTLSVFDKLLCHDDAATYEPSAVDGVADSHFTVVGDISDSGGGVVYGLRGFRRTVEERFDGENDFGFGRRGFDGHFKRLKYSYVFFFIRIAL